MQHQPFSNILGVIPALTGIGVGISLIGLFSYWIFSQRAFILEGFSPFF